MGFSYAVTQCGNSSSSCRQPHNGRCGRAWIVFNRERVLSDGLCPHFRTRAEAMRVANEMQDELEFERQA